MHPRGDFRRQTFLEILYIDLLKSGCLQKIPTLGEAVRALFFKMGSKIQYIT